MVRIGLFTASWHTGQSTENLPDLPDMAEKKKSLIARLFNFIWGVVITFYRILIMLSLLIFIMVLWTAFKGGPTPKVEDNVALVIWPAGDLVEEVDIDRRFVERVLREEPSQTSLRDLVEALQAGAKDRRISSAVLKLDTMSSASMGQIDELVAAMKEFQAAGKPVHAFGPFYEQSAYRIAAAASDVSVDPLGGVFIEGFSVYQNYFKEALDKLGIKMNVFRVGEFKAAVEPFLRNDMSPEARTANQEWLGDLWSQYTQGVAEGRSIKPGVTDQYVEEFRTSLETFRGDAAGYARQAGLVTHIETLNEFRERVGEMVGMDEDHGSFRQIHFSQYLNSVRFAKRKKNRLDGAPATRVALIVIEGEIVDGPGEPGKAGGETIARLMADARRDEDVAALVLRINSPGGSAWASEMIRREVGLLRKAGKPVVASMSGVAASGGYWVAMDANQIWASPSTITGSIGIFGLIPTIEKPLEKMGVHTDGVGTTALAGAFRIDKPLSEDVQAIFQIEIEKGYREFIEGVAKGRSMEVAAVEAIAQGRVWSGQDAKGFGLIDSFGGLQQAALAAAELAGLSEGQWTLEEFSAFPSFPTGILGSLFGAVGSKLGLLPETHRLTQFIEHTDVKQWLSRFDDRRGIYAHCMCASSNALGH